LPVHIKRRRGLAAIDGGLLRRRAVHLLQLLDLPDSELSILLTGDEEMTDLNREYLGRDRTTDVLAFSQMEGVGADLHRRILGDVVICVPQAERQAARFGGDLMDEVIVLLVHGVLHLIGYEHVGAGHSAAAKMRREQQRLVKLLHGKRK